MSPAASLLSDPDALPWLGQSAAVAFGRTMVVAPHPDDEALGCAGLIATLRSAALEVGVMVLSDGTGSHPNSRAWPAERLRALREGETTEAMALLGVTPERVRFLRLRDRFVPHAGDPAFEAAVEACAEAMRDFAPVSLLATWRRDPHPDHRATWQIVRTAAARMMPAPRLLEYPVWTWESCEPGDQPRADEVTGWRLDIRAHQTLKRRAIAAYRSQTTDLIDDDPEGCRLGDEFLANFDRPYEVFFEE